MKVILLQPTVDFMVQRGLASNLEYLNQLGEMERKELDNIEYMVFK